MIFSARGCCRPTKLARTDGSLTKSMRARSDLTALLLPCSGAVRPVLNVPHPTSKIAGLPRSIPCLGQNSAQFRPAATARDGPIRKTAQATLKFPARTPIKAYRKAVTH